MRYLRILATLSLAFLTGCKSVGEKLVDFFTPLIGFWIVLAGGCLSIVLLAGCTITTKNQGECGFRYGTEITFFHRASQTAPEPATIQSDAPALVDWLVKPKPTDDKPSPIAGPVPVTPVEPVP